MIQAMRVLVSLLFLMWVIPAFGEEEFLDPEIAFRFSARLVENGAIEVRYDIADGYYMYRERYRFSVEPAAAGAGQPQFPDGLWHEDEFFGRSEIYRGEVTIRIPIAPDETQRSVRLTATSQGCADSGICYLPATQSAEFGLLRPLGGPRNLP